MDVYLQMTGIISAYIPRKAPKTSPQINPNTKLIILFSSTQYNIVAQCSLGGQPASFRVEINYLEGI